MLTARRDLPVGARIAVSDVSWQAFPPNAINPAWITQGVRALPAPHILGPTPARAEVPGHDASALQQVTGAVVREPFLAGEPIIERKIVRGGQGGYLSVTLQPGMRAVAVPVNAETGVGGFILPGDRVDVILTRKADQPGGASGPNPGSIAQTILRNVRVLAIDQQVQPAKDSKTIVGGSATLEVPERDVEMLLGAKGGGELALALRSYADLGGPEGEGAGSRSGGASVRFIRAGHVSEAAAQ